MKKFVSSLILIFVCSVMFSLSLSDFDLEDQLLIKELVVSLDIEITFSNVEMLEGTHYNIIYESGDYIIVEKDGYYYIIPKD